MFTEAGSVKNWSRKTSCLFFTQVQQNRRYYTLWGTSCSAHNAPSYYFDPVSVTSCICSVGELLYSSPVKFFVRENNHHVLSSLLRTLNLETNQPQNVVSGFLGSHLRWLSKYCRVVRLSQLDKDSTWIARPVQWADGTYQAMEFIIN